MKRSERLTTGLATLVALFAILAGPAVAQEELHGFWEWDTTSGGIAGTFMTPETEGFTKQLELRDDGTAHLYYDEVWQSSGIWDGTGPFLLELMDFWMDGGGYGITGVAGSRQLGLNPPCCDLFAHGFHERAPVPVTVKTKTFGAIKRLWR